MSLGHSANLLDEAKIEWVSNKKHAKKQLRMHGLINWGRDYCWVVIDSFSINMNRRGTEPFTPAV